MLSGTIHVGGAKNAALPLMAASLLSDETLTLANLPHLVDIVTLANVLRHLGVSLTLNGYAAGGGHAVQWHCFTASCWSSGHNPLSQYSAN